MNNTVYLWGKPVPMVVMVVILVFCLACMGLGSVISVLFNSLGSNLTDPKPDKTSTRTPIVIPSRTTISTEIVTVTPTKPIPSVTQTSLTSTIVRTSPTLTRTVLQTIRATQTSIRNVSTNCPQGCITPPPNCLIKGNISSDGVKIYHVPSGVSYNQTKIDSTRGERWFCTEQEAMANGWRRSEQ
jgi:hypothetical protein